MITIIINNHNVKLYFRIKEQKIVDEPVHYEFFDKYYNGEPVMTIKDITHFLGVKDSAVRYRVKTALKRGKECYLLEYKQLADFKRRNSKFSKLTSSVYIVTQNGFEKIVKHFGVNVDSHKLFTVFLTL